MVKQKWERYSSIIYLPLFNSRAWGLDHFHQCYMTWRTRLYYRSDDLWRGSFGCRPTRPPRSPELCLFRPLYLMDKVWNRPQLLQKIEKKGKASDKFKRWLMGVIWGWGERPIERSRGDHKRVSEAVDLPGSGIQKTKNVSARAETVEEEEEVTEATAES